MVSEVTVLARQRRRVLSLNGLLMRSLGLALFFGLLATTAGRAEDYNCQWSLDCYRCGWVGGQGHCQPWTFTSSFCKCDEPGAGQGCIMWETCEACSDCLAAGKVSCTDHTDERPHSKRDWSHVVIGHAVSSERASRIG